MERKDISKVLLSRLDSLLPDWISYVDQKEEDDAKDRGIYSEMWLLRHLLDQIRKKINQENRNSAYSVLYGSSDRSEETIMEEFRKFTELLENNSRNLIIYERGILKLIQSDLREPNGLDNIKKTIKSLSIHLNESSSLFDQQLSNLNTLTLERIMEHDSSGYKKVEELLRYKSSSFRKEYRKNARSQKHLINGKLFNGFCSNKLSTLEEDKLAFKIANMMLSEVKSQMNLRRDSVNFVLGYLIKKSNSREIVNFLNQSKDLKENSRKLLVDLVESSYFPFHLSSPLPRKKRSSAPLDPFSKGTAGILHNLNLIVQELRDLQRRDRDSVDEIYNSELYRICNGGWWSVFAHLGTFGLCTNFTISANLAALFRRNMEDRGSMFKVLDTIFHFTFMPFHFTGSLLFSSKFLEIMEMVGKLYGLDHLKKLFDLIVEKFREFTEENRELIEWLLGYLNEITKHFVIVEN